MVVALDGARLATMRQLAADGVMPNVAAILERAAGGEVYGGSRRDPRGFWHAALSANGGRSGPERYIWSRAADVGLRSAAIALPDTREIVSPAMLVLPGADEVSGFIGDNAGAVVAIAMIEHGDLPWPYGPATAIVREAVSALPPGKTSDWLSVGLSPPDKRSGMFRIYRLDADVVYLSPVYRGATPAAKYMPGASERLVYVPDDPAWTVGSSRLRDYFYLHTRDLTDARADLAVGLAAGRWPLLVYFDSLLGLVEQAYPSNPAKLAGANTSIVRDAYRTMDARIGRLAAAAGSRTAIVLLGREPSAHKKADDRPQDARPMTGFVFFGGAAANSERVAPEPAHVTRVARMLVRLMDLPAAERLAARQAMTAQVSHSGVAANGVFRRESDRRGLPLTPDSLRELGLLSDSAGVTAADGEDASAASSVKD